ncbi:hypothetical protein BDZ97DRAFT_1154527 [Flammula alnicola]|nr:hypothetical protein BDZ97DRAFT_1154527 [Flammula alnicola]
MREPQQRAHAHRRRRRRRVVSYPTVTATPIQTSQAKWPRTSSATHGTADWQSHLARASQVGNPTSQAKKVHRRQQAGDGAFVGVVSGEEVIRGGTATLDPATSIADPESPPLSVDDNETTLPRLKLAVAVDVPPWASTVDVKGFYDKMHKLKADMICELVGVSISRSELDDAGRALVLALVAVQYVHTSTEHAESVLSTAEQLAAGLEAQPKTAKNAELKKGALKASSAGSGGDGVGNMHLRL